MKNVFVISIWLIALSSLTYFGINKLSSTNKSDKGLITTSNTKLDEDKIQNGDIIFHTSRSAQSKAIQLAIHSHYSHVGIVFKKNNAFYVFEAVQPVKFTPLQKWIERGENQHYVVKRLKQSEQILTDEVLTNMQNYGQKFLGKNYDLYFEWSDDKIYCSELVWKIYKECTGVDLGELDELSDFDLTSKTVKDLMQKRYGDNIPMNEKVISPAKIFDSNKLITVTEN